MGEFTQTHAGPPQAEERLIEALWKPFLAGVSGTNPERHRLPASLHRAERVMGRGAPATQRRSVMTLPPTTRGRHERVRRRIGHGSYVAHYPNAGPLHGEKGRSSSLRQEPTSLDNFGRDALIGDHKSPAKGTSERSCIRVLGISAGGAAHDHQRERGVGVVANRSPARPLTGVIGCRGHNEPSHRTTRGR
jgi:hypothetical protein